jgi:hypothetical protein
LDEKKFVEQQRFMHKFVYSDLLQNHGDGFSMFSRHRVTSLSPNCYFVHSKQPTEGEYHEHPHTKIALKMVEEFVECNITTTQDKWEAELYKESMREYWKQIYKHLK